jgi:hypothetical protein
MTNMITATAITAAALAIAVPATVSSMNNAELAETSSTTISIADTTNHNDIAWETFVGNTGEQDAVDECTGGVTYMPTVSDYVGKAYYPIHEHCGGAPILSLEDGDQVKIDDVIYTVVDSVDVQRGDTAADIDDLAGTALLQTCYPDSEAMRIVAIQANA